MSQKLNLPAWMAVAAVRFCGGSAVNCVTPMPCYSIVGGRGNDVNTLVLTEAEAAVLAKALLRDIRRNKPVKP